LPALARLRVRLNATAAQRNAAACRLVAAQRSGPPLHLTLQLPGGLSPLLFAKYLRHLGQSLGVTQPFHELLPVPLAIFPLESLALQPPALLLEIQLRGPMVFAPHGGHFAKHLAQAVPAFRRGKRFIPQLIQGARQLDEEHRRQPLAQRMVEVRVGHLGSLFGQPVQARTVLFGPFPVAVTAQSPIGEVLLVDGPGAELGGEHLADFGHAIEPSEQVLAQFAILEPLIELLADFVR